MPDTMHKTDERSTPNGYTVTYESTTDFLDLTCTRITDTSETHKLEDTENVSDTEFVLHGSPVTMIEKNGTVTLLWTHDDIVYHLYSSLPADTCPVPSSECGALVIDALPHMGNCFISSSMPCDGSTMASSYMARRFPDLPVFHLCFPVRYEDEATLKMGAEDIRACIKFIEEKTGAQWSWDAYFSAMKRFNEETKYELEKWEVNKTAYPQLLGPCYELFRKWNYEMDGGIDPRVMKTCKKVNKLLLQAYERRDEAWVGKMRYRGIVWSCPAHYYANFSNWLANCWGINILVEMESLNFTKPLETEDPELALLELARLYERMVMRRHTNGGYQNVVDELWRQCEAWNANIIIMYQNVACKNMATVQGILDEQGRERGYHLIWIEHDLMDPRTVSRKTMSD